MNLLTQLADDSNQIKISSSDLNLKGAPTTVGSSNVEAILGTVYLWAGIVAVLVIIIGGIRYATANGEASKIKAAKDTILYAVAGLVVIMMAAAITQFVIQNVAK